MSTDRVALVDLRRERLMMRAFQNPLVGPVLRKLVNPQAIIEDGMAFWSLAPDPDRRRPRRIHPAGGGPAVGADTDRRARLASARRNHRPGCWSHRLRAVLREATRCHGRDQTLRRCCSTRVRSHVRPMDFPRVTAASPNDRCELVAKAREALPGGGALDRLRRDDHVRPVGRLGYQSLLSSLNIMLETREGYESTTADCADMLRANGFGRVKVRHLIGPTSMVYGLKR